MTQRSSINLPTLVLNKSWNPIQIKPVYKAITKVLNEQAVILDPETSTTYSMEEWMKLPLIEGKPFIQSAHSKIRVPEIVILTKYDKTPYREVKLNRKNLLIRDNFTCQYTGKKITKESATIDHVIPRSRGGKSTWDNLVMSCLEVNAKKADRTPSEAGLKLLKKPIRPSWNPVYSRFSNLSPNKVPESWKLFVKVDGVPFGFPMDAHA